MTDLDKKLAKKYVSQWHKNGLIKTSVGVKLLAFTNKINNIDDFIIFVLKKTSISYKALPNEYQNNVNFLVRAVLSVDEGLNLLTEVAETNKAIYAKIIDNLSAEEIAFVLLDVELSKLPRTKLVAKLKREVSNQILKKD